MKTNEAGTPIRAELSGADTCSSALGITAKSDAPVLALCRKLVDAGHEPNTPLEAYRGDMLALRVKSIGQGAQLQVNGNTRLVFAGAPKRRTAPPMPSVASPSLDPPEPDEPMDEAVTTPVKQGD
jgi:hypothetical protein